MHTRSIYYQSSLIYFTQENPKSSQYHIFFDIEYQNQHVLEYFTSLFNEHFV